MKILVTGAAGFIGADLCRKLLLYEHQVVAIDNINDYYSPQLKRDRLQLISDKQNFNFVELDILDSENIKQIFSDHSFDVVVHLAAQAGVRYSIEHPLSYVNTNLVGFANILEACRHNGVAHLIYASSSSVYGVREEEVAYKESDRVDNPVSLYAATKKSNELMAYCYSHIHDLYCTGLRFFTVYGPWGRPDMAAFRFVSRMLEGQPIPVYNYGNLMRDFTYIDDITEGVINICHKMPQNTDDKYRLYNIGLGEPVHLMRFVHILEKYLGVKAIIQNLPMQMGDVPYSAADISKLQRDFNYRPQVTIEEGLKQYTDWYRSYYK